MSGPDPFPEKDLRGLVIHPAGVVDARRDLHLFLRYVRERGLRRTHRENRIPKADARRLAKIVSYAGERVEVRETGEGPWSEHISRLAREMKLVSFDTEGSYAGYSSTEPSYPDNYVEIDEAAVGRYLALSPAAKETAILDAHLQMVESEFFNPALLLPNETFESFGCATGPAGRMDLPRIRRRVLGYLAGLEPGLWYDLESTVADFGRLHPRLILDSAEGTAKWDTGDLYRNFREYPLGQGRHSGEGTRITTKTPRAFFRVEGRYLEYFLCGIPYLLGFVSLAERPLDDPRGLDVNPPRGRIRAFRVTERLGDLLGGEPGFDRVRVTVLPDLDVVVEATSYPETTLEDLEPLTVAISEDGPLHRRKLVRERVVQAVAEAPDGLDPVAKLETLTEGHLPPNVAVELAGWSQRGGKFTVYEGFALLETLGMEERDLAVPALKRLAIEAGPGDFSLVRDPERALDRLERAGLVPVPIRHQEARFAPSTGALGAPSPAAGKKGTGSGKSARPGPSWIDAVLEVEDLVGLNSNCPELIAALVEKLGEDATETGDGRLILPAAALPKLRAALSRLKDRFRVERR